MNSYEHTSRDFLPLSVIRSACAGDTDAVEQVLQHYRGYINKLCTGILYDKHGQAHAGSVSPFHASRYGLFVVPQKHIGNGMLLQADKALLFLDKESPQDNGGAS
jgi:hypothetical protein